ncbi:MAG: RNA methyltransferase [Lentimicrobiaceae bacterium]|nr:RNA methyltransferase [Lentimicrobiaceae bacterium]
MRKLSLSELNRVGVEQYKESKKKPIVCVLDNVRSKHNVGSIFRTCDAFLVEEIHLCGLTPLPPDKEISKTALGATESVSWKYYEHTKQSILELKEKGYLIVCVEQTTESIDIYNFKNPKMRKIALVLGHEVCGIDDQIVEMCDVSLEIPQFGTKHSLNVSVAFGIVISKIFTFF